MNWFKFKSIFLKTFLMLLLSSSILLVVYNLIFIGFFNKTYQQRLIGTNINMVDKANDYLDLILSNVVEKANLLSHDAIAINATVIPDFNLSGRNFDLISRLRYFVSENPFIDSVYLYVPLNDMIFSSSFGISDIDQFKDRLAIDEYKDQKRYSGQFYLRTSLDTSGTGKTVSFYKDLPKEDVWRTGQIIINLDADALYSAVSNYVDLESDEISIIDQQGHVVLGRKDSVGSLFPAQGLSSQIEHEVKGYHLGHMNGEPYLFFYDTSDNTGWKYIYSVQQNKFKMFSQITYTVLMPSILIFIVISVLFAGALSRSFYLPIENLIKIILPEHKPGGKVARNKGQNEYDFIGMAYSTAIEKKDRLEELVHKSTPLVRDELFSMLLHGKEIDDKEIQFFSQYLDMKRYLQGQYSVLVLQVSNKDNAQYDDDSVERKYNLLQVKNDISGIGEDLEKIIFLSLDLSQIIVICRFEIESSDGGLKIDQFVKNIKIMISKQNKFKVIASVGRTYQGLEHINDSYDEAKEALKYSIYLGIDEIISIDNIDKDQKNDAISDSYMGYIKKVIAAISTGDHDKTSEHLHEFYNYIKRNNPHKSHYINYIFMKLIDSLGQFTITSNLQVSSIFGREKTVYQQLEKLETFEEMTYYTSNICHEVVLAVEGANANKHSKYITKAIEYIEKNFANSDLSLNQLAEYVGINSTYLSSLFKSECGDNFIDHINCLRINKAKALLDSTNITVKEAGYTVGFNTIQNFIRTFKKFEGITPGKYKESTGYDESDVL